MSSGGVGLVLLGLMQQEVQAKTHQLVAQDLRFDDGVHKATELQGQIKGLNRAIDIILEVAEEGYENDGSDSQ